MRVKKKITRQDAIYRIALAGICAALSLLLVWLSVLVRFSTIAFYVAAGLVLMIPMTQRYYLSSLFAYAVSAGLSFVIAGDVVAVAGYIVYFGPMALITGFLLNVKLKWWISLIIKLAYINGALALLFYVLGTIMIDTSIIEKLEFWMVALVGSVALVAIDFVVQLTYKQLGKIVGKVLRKNNTGGNEEIVVNDDEDDVVNDKDNPFEDEM